MPSRWRSGTRVTPSVVGEPGQVGGEGQVGVGDDHPVDAPAGQVGDAGLHRAVEAQARASRSPPRPGARPTPAPRRRRTRRRRAADPRPAAPVPPWLVASSTRAAGSSTSASRSLACGEGLHRHEHGGASGVESGIAPSTMATPYGSRGGRRNVPAMPIRVAVIGGGSWGTTVAHLCAKNAPTTLWARRADVAAEVRDKHTQQRLPRRVRAHAQPPRHLVARGGRVRRRTCSSWACRRTACGTRHGSWPGCLRPWVPVVSLSKGLEQGTRLRMTEVLQAGAARATLRRAHRPEPGQGDPGRRRGRLRRRHGGRDDRRRAAGGLRQRPASACTRTPTWSAARWPAR